jgi:hypothetical protein
MKGDQVSPLLLIPVAVTYLFGRAIVRGVRAVSRRHHTAAAGVRSQVRSCGLCGAQNGTGADFLRVLWFPLPILIPPYAPYSSSGVGTGGQLRVVTDVPSGPHPKKLTTNLFTWCSVH